MDRRSEPSKRGGLPGGLNRLPGTVHQVPRSRRIRVALVTHSMCCGGLETVLLRLGRYLSAAGFDPEILTTFEPGEWFGKIGEWGLKGVHVDAPRSAYPCTPLIHSMRVGRAIVKREFDVVFLNHAAYAQASAAMLPQGVAVIPVLHNDSELVYKVGCANLEAVNALVGVSPKVCEAARLRVRTTPVVEILNGVEMPSQEAWGKRVGPTRPIVLAFVGRLEQNQKNILLLPGILKACLDRGMDVTLRVVGDGPDKGRLLRNFQELHLLERVEHPGAVPPEQVYPILLGSHALLLPSYHEGLPIVALESQACGCVPVASLLPGITDVAIRDRRTGILVRSLTAEGFAEAVAELQDPARWSEMSAAAHRHILSAFSVEAMGRRYARLVEDALEDRYPLPRPRRFSPAAFLSLFPVRENTPEWMRRIYRTIRAAAVPGVAGR